MRVQTTLILLSGFALGFAAVADDGAEMAAAKGRVTFRLSCASCHGQAATGDGPVAEYLKVPPANLTTLSARNGGEFPAERVRATIDGRETVRGHGSRDMPVWGEVFTDSHGEDEANAKIDELVAFLRTIQAKDG